MKKLILILILSLCGASAFADPANLSATLQYLFPTALPPQSWTLTDTGSGPQIAAWYLQATQPTQLQIDTAEPLMLAARASAATATAARDAHLAAMGNQLAPGQIFGRVTAGNGPLERITLGGGLAATAPGGVPTLTSSGGAVSLSGTTATSLTGVLKGNGTLLSTATAGTDYAMPNANTTGTAAALTTPRAINGVNFDGTAPITVAAAAGTLTGAALPAGVTTASGLTTTAGGPLGTAAFTAATAYATAAQGTLAASALQPAGSAAALTGFPTLNQSTTGSAATLTTGRTIGMTGDVTYTSPTFNGSANVTTTSAIGAGKVTDTMLLDTTAATSATTGAVTVNMTSSLVTCAPTGAMTLNASGGRTGRKITFVFTTSGTTSFAISFGTNFISQGSLATGTVTAKTLTVTFISTNGTSWVEIARTLAM